MIILPGVEQPRIASTGDKTEAESGTQENVSDTFSQQIDAARRAQVENSDPASSAQKETAADSAEKVDRLKRMFGQQERDKAVEHKAIATLVASGISGDPAGKKDRPGSQSAADDTASDLQAISALLGMLPATLQTDSQATPATVHDNLHRKASGAGHSSQAETTLSSLPADSASSATGSVSRGADSLSLIKNSADRLRPAEAAPPAPVAPGGQAINLASPVAAADPAASAQVSAPLTAQLGSQGWQQQLSQQVTLFTRQGIQQAELRLHPEHLGKVDITLKLDDNQLQLQIMSPHSHVRAALEAALPVLRTSLSESGVQLGQSQVGDENLARQQSGEQGEHAGSRTPHFALTGDNDDESMSAISTTLQRLADRQGAVDIFA